jgi:hypothetical protein
MGNPSCLMPKEGTLPYRSLEKKVAWKRRGALAALLESCKGAVFIRISC